MCWQCDASYCMNNFIQRLRVPASPKAKGIQAPPPRGLSNDNYLAREKQDSKLFI